MLITDYFITVHFKEIFMSDPWRWED